MASQEDGFLFGSYQPSAVHPTAGNSRARSRRSVRSVDIFSACFFVFDVPFTLHAMFEQSACVLVWTPG